LFLANPAVVVERETTSDVGDGFDAAINSLGYIVMERRTDPVTQESR
jgi:hypothetical protein